MGPAAMTAARQQQEEEQLLASCLGLLDIRQTEGAKQLDISAGTFRKPNAKAFELVLYHTYNVIKGKAAAKKNFRGLWPLPEKDKKLAKDFYQRIQEWLKESGRSEHSLAAFQRNPSGPKLVSFLCDLAHWALEVQHARMFADDVVEQPNFEDPVLLVSLAEPLLTAAEAHNQQQVEQLLRLCQEGAQLQEEAERTAEHLKEMYYELTAQLCEAATAGEGEEQLQPPSIKLASILPAQLTAATTTSGSSSLEPAALSALPEELQRQHQQVAQLWQQLQQYMEDFKGLRSMVQHLVGSAAHPYAIDAVQLRAYGQAGGFEGMAAAPAAALDIAALVEAWLFDVGSVCRYVKTLAGYTANLEQQQDNQQRGWLPLRPGGIGRCSFMSPLVATSDAASHATHLYAQLSLHRACRDGLLGLRTTLEQHADEAAARMHALEDQLSPLYEQQLRQAELEAAAAEAVLLGAAEADAASPYSHAPVPSAGAGDWAGRAGPGLFSSGSHLQLIPPTPMLQQQVAKQQRRQQQQQQTRAAGQQGPAATAHDSLQQAVHPLPLLPPGQSSAVPPAAAAVPEEVVVSPVLLLPEAGTSPEVDGSPASPVSSASSAERPAAELLMSRELMDLDLVGDEEGEELDDGGVFSTAQHSSFRALGPAGRRGRSPGAAEVGRISFARFSLGSDSLSPILAVAAGGGGSLAGGTTGGAGGDCAPVLEPVGEDSASEGGESWRSFSLGGQPSQVSAPQGASNDTELLGAQQHQPRRDDDTPTVDWGNKQAGVGDGVGVPPPAGVVDSVDRSPSAQQPLIADPIAPMSAESAECLSSAKPRRLTFAAAACSGGPASRSSTSLLADARDTASSLSISSGDDGCDGGADVAESTVAPAAGAAAAGASSALAALRQRFADASMRSRQ